LALRNFRTFIATENFEGLTCTSLDWRYVVYISTVYT